MNGRVTATYSIAIDRRGDQKPLMLAIVGGQIRTTAAERYAKRAARNEHV